jgi:hypothetical protein
MQTYVSPYLGEDFRKQDHIRQARVALEAEQNVNGNAAETRSEGESRFESRSDGNSPHSPTFSSEIIRHIVTVTRRLYTAKETEFKIYDFVFRNQESTQCREWNGALMATKKRQVLSD